jgi:hypothetical protein
LETAIHAKDTADEHELNESPLAERIRRWEEDERMRMFQVEYRSPFSMNNVEVGGDGGR